MYDKNYEDFEVGQVFEHRPAKTITESDNNLFCLVTWNRQPLHSDAEYAAEHRADGQRVVCGPYVFSLAIGMSVPEVSGTALAALNYTDVVHMLPVHIGDTVRCATEVLEMRVTRNGKGIIKVRSEMFNQHDETVLLLTREIMLPRRTV